MSKEKCPTTVYIYFVYIRFIRKGNIELIIAPSNTSGVNDDGLV